MIKLLFCIFFIFVRVKSEDDETNDVLEYTDDDFDVLIKDHALTMVFFYAPWCMHCKNMKPQFEKAAAKLKSNKPPIFLIKVDCTVELKTCAKYGISGYPTIKIFRNGEETQEYTGARNGDAIVKFLQSRIKPGARLLKTLSVVEKFKNNDEPSVIGYFKGKSQLKRLFMKTADVERETFRFGYVSDLEVVENTGFSNDIVYYIPKIYHNKFDPTEFRYSGVPLLEKVKQFIVNETTGIAGVRTQKNLKQYERLPMFVVYYKIDFKKDPKGTSYVRNRVLHVAQEFLKKAYFAVSNKKEFITDLRKFNLNATENDNIIVTCQSKNDQKFLMSESFRQLFKCYLNFFSLENLRKFVKDVLSNKAKPYIRSEPVPPKQGHVKTVVTKNFQEIVYGSKKDVLIEFYAPWCGHCKALEPKYEKLAEKLKNEDVIIAKMDATSNEVPPEFDVSSYPTIYWLPKNAKKKPILYQGNREVNDFIKFIAKKSTNGLRNFSKEGKKKKKAKKSKDEL